MGASASLRDVAESVKRGVPGRARLREDDSMNSQITGLRVASVVFGLMAIAQLVRLFRLT